MQIYIYTYVYTCIYTYIHKQIYVHRVTPCKRRRARENDRVLLNSKGDVARWGVFFDEFSFVFFGQARYRDTPVIGHESSTFTC